MKDKSCLKELIERRKRRLYLGSILFPIIIIFPCVISFVSFYVQKYAMGALFAGIAVALSLLLFFIVRASKKYLAALEKELEDLQHNKK